MFLTHPRVPHTSKQRVELCAKLTNFLSQISVGLQELGDDKKKKKETVQPKFMCKSTAYSFKIMPFF